MKQSSGFSAVELVVAIVVAGAVISAGYVVVHKHSVETNQKQATSKQVSNVSTTPATSSSNVSDAVLSSDLSSATASQNQSNQDATSSSTAINDQQNAVAVPTN